MVATSETPSDRWSIPLFLPSGKHTKNYGKSPFFMGKHHYKWWFSIVMLNYQRVGFQSSKVQDFATNPQLTNYQVPHPLYFFPRNNFFFDLVLAHFYASKAINVNIQIAKWMIPKCFEFGRVLIGMNWKCCFGKYLMFPKIPKITQFFITAWWFLPSWKIWVRQWEGWHPIYYGIYGK